MNKIDDFSFLYHNAVIKGLILWARDNMDIVIKDNLSVSEANDIIYSLTPSEQLKFIEYVTNIVSARPKAIINGVKEENQNAYTFVINSLEYLKHHYPHGLLNI